MIVVRIVTYEGTEEWIRATLSGSIQSVLECPKGTITVKDVYNELERKDNFAAKGGENKSA